MNGLALCAGYGGLELAIERVFPRYRTVCYVEGEAFVAQHLIKKMEEGRLDKAPIWSNVRTFDGEPWRGKVDFISGGFPCQPYSSAGKQMAERDPRDLWNDFVRIIGEVRPGFLFFENVPGVVKWRLQEIVLDLDKLGYNVAWGIIAASEVGAPHRRKRWFLFGVRNTDRDGFSQPTNKKNGERIIEEMEMEGPIIKGHGSIDTYTNNTRKCFSSGTIQQEHRNDISGLCSNVSNANRGSFEESQRTDREISKTSERLSRRKNEGETGEVFGCSCENATDTDSERIKRSRRINGEASETKQTERHIDQKDKWGGGFESWWEVEPSMGRLVDGASDWVDKLRILGNGVVPQQAYSALQILGGRLAWGTVANRDPNG